MDNLGSLHRQTHHCVNFVFTDAQYVDDVDTLSQYQVNEQLSSSKLFCYRISPCRSEIVSCAHQLFIYKRLPD